MKEIIQIGLEIFGIVGAIAAIIGAIIAVPAYRQNSRLNRTKWLESLFERFYESDRYVIVRDVIDDNAKENNMEAFELAVAKALGKSNDNRAGRIALNNYLNFFEFVANLEVLRQLKKEELNLLFSYDLDQLKKHSVLRPYIDADDNGFEKLRELLRVIR
jgi:hypothetical protein